MYIVDFFDHNQPKETMILKETTKHLRGIINNYMRGKHLSYSKNMLLQNSNKGLATYRKEQETKQVIETEPSDRRPALYCI